MANEKEDKDGVMEALFERTKDYAETRVDLFKLKAIKKNIRSRFLCGFTYCFLVFVFNFFIPF